MKPNLTKLEELAKKLPQTILFNEFCTEEEANAVEACINAFPSILKTLRAYEEMEKTIRKWNAHMCSGSEDCHCGDGVPRAISNLNKKLSEIE